MGNSLSERDKKEAEFGERIYNIVQQIYPESSENITGMLLELEREELERLLTSTNQKELYARIHQAAENMPSSDVPERSVLKFWKKKTIYFCNLKAKFY